ncbi:MAG: hypothetical protein ACTSSA_09590 [Candidatus Freyarchaeota archaeon]
MIHLSEFDYNALPDQEKIYNISPGGTSPLGILGYIDAALELKQQIEKGLMPEPECQALRTKHDGGWGPRDRKGVGEPRSGNPV